MQQKYATLSSTHRTITITTIDWWHMLCDTCSTRHNQLTPAANFSHGTHLQLTTTDKTTTHQMLLTTTLTTPLTITQLDAICSASPC